MTGGIVVVAADTDVLDDVSGELADGRFLDAASQRAADRRARRRRRRAARHRRPRRRPGVRVWLGGQWFAVIGILEPAPLAPELDSAGAHRLPGRRRAVRHDDVAVARCTCARTPTRSRRCATCSPARSTPRRPARSTCPRPSDALEARAHDRRRAAQPAARPRRRGAARRRRRDHQRDGDLGARTAQPRSACAGRSAPRGGTSPRQFLVEAALLAAARRRRSAPPSAPAVTAVYARSQGWLVDVPVAALAAGAGLRAGGRPARRRLPGHPGRPPRPRRSHPAERSARRGTA